MATSYLERPIRTFAQAVADARANSRRWDAADALWHARISDSHKLDGDVLLHLSEVSEKSLDRSKTDL